MSQTPKQKSWNHDLQLGNSLYLVLGPGISLSEKYFKGELCSFWEEIQTQNCNISNMCEVIIQTQKNVIHKWINKLFSEENKDLRTLFEVTKVAGSAKYKQSKIVGNCVVL